MPNSNHETRTLAAAEFRVVTSDDGSRTLSGLIPYNSLSADLGGWNEMIAPGAFSTALEPTADVVCLRDHDASILLGRTKSKTLVLSDSDEGLRFSCSLPKTTQASDLAESVDRGDLDANSFGFICVEDKWLADKSGNMLRTLVSVELLEISPCSFPAYPASQVAVRNLPPSAPTELRSKLTKSETRTNDNGCDCDCDSCVANDCMKCSNEDCTDPDCTANQRSRSLPESEVHKLHMRLALAQAGK